MVSALHESVLGTTVPGVSSVQSVASNYDTYNNTGSSTTTSGYDTTSFSSTGQMMAAEGSHPPDFNSMSTEEFREHLIELQEKMAANGVDTSGFVDPSSMSEDDLNALKDEMSSMGSRGANGRPGPPPPPPESISVEDDEDEEDFNAIDVLLNALENNDDDDEDESLTAQLLNSL